MRISSVLLIYLNMILLFSSIKFTISSVCKDESICTFSQTCCKLKFGYGCCPYQYATCCDDLENCCPQDYKCNLEKKSCDFNGKLAFLNNLKVEEILEFPLTNINSFKGDINCHEEYEKVKTHLTEVIKDISTFNLIKAISAIEKNIIITDDYLKKCPEKTPCNLVLEKFNTDSKHIKELIHHKQIYGGIKELKELVEKGYEVLHCK